MATPLPVNILFLPFDTRLKFMYKGSEAFAHVSSAAMARSSPVLNFFLFPPWSTTEDDADATALTVQPVQDIDFTEDGEAFLFLLCSAHGQFGFLPPQRPALNVLCQVAVLCKKYICIDAWKARMEKWVAEKWSNDEGGKGGTRRARDCMETLELSHAFKLGTFELAAKGLFLDTRSSDTIPQFTSHLILPEWIRGKLG